MRITVDAGDASSPYRCLRPKSLGKTPDDSEDQVNADNEEENADEAAHRLTSPAGFVQAAFEFSELWVGWLSGFDALNE